MARKLYLSNAQNFLTEPHFSANWRQSITLAAVVKACQGPETTEVPEPPKFVIGLFPDIFTHDYRVEVRNVNESPS